MSSAQDADNDNSEQELSGLGHEDALRGAVSGISFVSKGYTLADVLARGSETSLLEPNDDSPPEGDNSADDAANEGKCCDGTAGHAVWEAACEDCCCEWDGDINVDTVLKTYQVDLLRHAFTAKIQNDITNDIT